MEMGFIKIIDPVQLLEFGVAGTILQTNEALTSFSRNIKCICRDGLIRHRLVDSELEIQRNQLEAVRRGKRYLFKLQELSGETHPKALKELDQYESQLSTNINILRKLKERGGS